MGASARRVILRHVVAVGVALLLLLVTALPAAFADDRLDCRWTVNSHQHTEMFSSLSATVRDVFNKGVAYTLYPEHTPGWIEYPTDLFAIHPNVDTVADLDQGSCSSITNATTAYEGSYAHVFAASTDGCCAACSADPACRFAVFQGANPVLTHRCWMMNASSLTPRADKGSQLLVVRGRPAPPAPPPTYWLAAWEHNLNVLPTSMAHFVIEGLEQQQQQHPPRGAGAAVGGAPLLLIDYEPQYRPTWRFTTMGTGSAPEWAAYLAQVHSAGIDTNWTTLVQWAVPHGATNWTSMTASQQQNLEKVSWDYFVRKYTTKGLVAIKSALAADARFDNVTLSVWNWPFKFWHRTNATDWDSMMDEMGWLWAELPVFMPDLYSEFYSGTVADKPAVLPRCTAQNASATVDYFQANVDNSLRLRQKYNPGAKVLLSVWWHYMCGQDVTQNLGYFVNTANLDGLFGATGHDGIALWGSVGDFKGEDNNVTEVVEYLDKVWAPYLAKHCRV